MVAPYTIVQVEKFRRTSLVLSPLSPRGWDQRTERTRSKLRNSKEEPAWITNDIRSAVSKEQASKEPRRRSAASKEEQASKEQSKERSIFHRPLSPNEVIRRRSLQRICTSSGLLRNEEVDIAPTVRQRSPFSAAASSPIYDSYSISRPVSPLLKTLLQEEEEEEEGGIQAEIRQKQIPQISRIPSKTPLGRIHTPVSPIQCAAQAAAVADAVAAAAGISPANLPQESPFTPLRRRPSTEQHTEEDAGEDADDADESSEDISSLLLNERRTSTPPPYRASPLRASPLRPSPLTMGTISPSSSESSAFLFSPREVVNTIEDKIRDFPLKLSDFFDTSLGCSNFANLISIWDIDCKGELMLTGNY